MPRGGKRPGAGAPKGNFNAVRSGNHSSRMLLVYLALLNHPDRTAVAWELYEQGFFPPPRKRFNKDVRGVVAYLYRRWFDSSATIQSTTINNDQTGAAAPAETPAASFNPAPSRTDQP